MNKKILRLSAAVVSAFAMAGAAQAELLWSNNAGTPRVQSFDTTTGVMADNFLGEGNGRGIVVVGGFFYTTNASDSNIVKHDRTTGLAVSSCSIAGAGGISTIGFDGDNFWTSDYSGANKAYKIDTNCNVLKTITLVNSEGFYDGLEFFNGKLIANRFDGGFTGGNQYSVYDLDGNLLQANFIDTTGHGNGTGIAFNGTDFYISDIFNGRATIWDGVTGAFKGALNLIGTSNLIEDLSFDYEDRPDTCRINCDGQVPEPTSLSLLALALVGAGMAVRRRRRADD
jgi:hypothetical protein